MFKKVLVGLMVIGLLFSLSGTIFAKRIKITVIIGSTGTHTGFELRRLMKEGFEKENPNIELVFEPLPGGKIQDTILLRAAGGNLPDVFPVQPDVRLDVFQERRMLTPLDELLGQEGIDTSKYSQKLFDTCRREGKLWALPEPAYINGMLHFNKRIFDEEGLPYPTQDMPWEDFKKLCERLVKRDTKGNITRYGLYDGVAVLNWPFLHGARIADDSLNPTKILFGEQKFRDAIQEYIDMSRIGATLPLIVYKALGMGKPKLFAEEKVAMIIDQMSYLGMFSECTFDWDVIIPPSPEGADIGFYGGINAWAVASSSKNPESAAKWVAWYVLSPASLKIQQKAFPLNISCMPYDLELRKTFNEIAETRKPDSWRLAYVQQEYIVPPLSFKDANKITSIYFPAVSDVLYERKPVDSLIEIAKEAQKILDELLSK